MSLLALLQACLLAANSVAILNEERFLDPNGWSYSTLLNNPEIYRTVKGQIISAIHAVSYLRVPLIAVNLLFALVALIT